MRGYINRWLPRGSFLRNVTILSGGTVFAQAVMVLALPIVTRLYSPEDFALLAVYAAIIGIVSVVACLRYNIAIPLPEDDADGMALLAVSLLSALIVSLVCTLPVILAPGGTARLLGQTGLQPYLWMIPLGVFVAAAYDALQYWASRKKRFALVTQTRMTRAIGGVSTQLGFGVFNPAPFGLIFGHMIYGGLGVIGLLRNLLRDDRKLCESLGARSIGVQARTYYRFPLYSVPESLFNTAGVELPIILIAAIVAGPEAGFLFLAMRVMGLPMGLIGSSVSQVFLAEAPAKLRDGMLAEFTRRTMWVLFKTGTPPILMVAAISPFAFPLIFGAEWERAGWLVLWMSPWFVLQFVASPVSIMIHVIGKQQVAALLQLSGFVIRVGAVLIASIFAEGAVSEIYSISGALFYALYLLVIVRISKFS